MERIELKLKQASAVLGVAPKDLQNLVQFKVLTPIRRDSFFWFDKRLLLEAKIALYLKESLGTSTEVLALFTRALSSLKDEDVATVRYLSLRSRLQEAESRSRFVFPSEIWQRNWTNNFHLPLSIKICLVVEKDPDGSASSYAVSRLQRLTCRA